MCFECRKGLFFDANAANSNEQCVLDCKMGSFGNQLTSTCDVCSDGCKACTTYEICDVCARGYSKNLLE